MFTRRRETLGTAIKDKKGTTFVELILYIAIVLIIVPALLALSIYTVSEKRVHTTEKNVNDDIKFVEDRISNLISEAKRIDVENSVFDDVNGKLALIMPDDSEVIIKTNPDTKKVEIFENGSTTNLSSGDSRLESLSYEKIADAINDPSIVLGISTRIHMAGPEENSETQEYITSTDLENGDFDEDGCLDYMDKFPRHAECCGDAESDGICDELDNCVMAFNPFQEDFDGDNIGNECDDNVFFDGEGEGGGMELGAFNCQTQESLIDLINKVPPLPPGVLKNILVSSSPLSPEVISAVIDRNPQLPPGILQQIFTLNTKLYENEYQRILNMGLPNGIKNLIIAAQNNAHSYAWQGDENYYLIDYSVHLSEDSSQAIFDNPKNQVGADAKLGTSGLQMTDVFIIHVNNGTNNVSVAVNAGGSTDISVLTGPGSSVVDTLGFLITLEDIYGDAYAFTISSVSNTNPLNFVNFNFGEGAIVTDPSSGTNTIHRYSYYCPGGCSQNCGDIGTGIRTGDIFTDKCYKPDNSWPEWCTIWQTFSDDNSYNPAFMGGTQSGEQTLYWEKSFQTILTQSQIANLHDITVAGEVAYQSTNQFFCDSLSSSCPMRGELVGSQDVELYNWDNGNWELVSSTNPDGSTSDQQKFEITYSGANPQKYIGGDSNKVIKSRIKFRWNGIPPQGSPNAPSFMLLDYFTLHLKW